jgi:hypothetical protein
VPPPSTPTAISRDSLVALLHKDRARARVSKTPVPVELKLLVTR